jgi:predicted ribosomally synthesized peptide with SipW-like signal peptide
MTGGKKMKSRMLVSLLVIALAAAVIGGATMAWFTDSDVSDEVTFSAGTLLIAIDDLNLEGEEGLKINNMNPGDVKNGSFVVVNEGTKNLQFMGYLCWQDIIGQLNDDLNQDMRQMLIDKGYGDEELSDVLNFKISVRNATWNNGLGEGVFYNGTLPGVGPLKFGLAELAPSESLTYDVEVTLPGEGTGNDYQGSKINLVFGVIAGQTTNNAPAPVLPDGFVCPFGASDATSQ